MSVKVVERVQRSTDFPNRLCNLSFLIYYVSSETTLFTNCCSDNHLPTLSQRRERKLSRYKCSPSLKVTIALQLDNYC